MSSAQPKRTSARKLLFAPLPLLPLRGNSGGGAVFGGPPPPSRHVSAADRSAIAHHVLDPLHLHLHLHLIVLLLLPVFHGAADQEDEGGGVHSVTAAAKRRELERRHLGARAHLNERWRPRPPRSPFL